MLGRLLLLGSQAVAVVMDATEHLEVFVREFLAAEPVENLLSFLKIKEHHLSILLGSPEFSIEQIPIC